MKTSLLNNTSKQNVSNNSGWKTFELNKQYSNAALHFKISYPEDWQPSEEKESVIWYSTEKQNVFSVSWLDPEITYDIEGICRPGMCNKLSEVSRPNNVTIEILKPTPERQKSFDLSDTFLQGEIINSNNRITPKFNTEFLSVNDFKTILATFSFIPN